MNVAQEIEIIQFAQGVQSVADLPNRLRQLDEKQKCTLFLRLDYFVEQVKPTDADIGQALADSALSETDVNAHVLDSFRSKSSFGRVVYMPNGEYGPANTFLLYLFKVAYQRQFALEKGNPDNWWYWDLSSSEVAQSVLMSHQGRSEEIYAHPSFRSEFVSLAKLWHEDMISIRARYKEPDPAPEPQTHFDFVGYDEVVTKSIEWNDDKFTRAISLLRDSLTKAVSVRYGIDDEQARKLVFDVLERHVRETYHTNLVGEDLSPGD